MGSVMVSLDELQRQWPGPNNKPALGDKKLSVQDVISALCDSPDDCLEEITARIERMEANLARLKRVQKMLGGTTRQNNASVDPATTEKVEQCIIKHGPIRAKGVSAKTGVSYTMVGKIAGQSKRIRKLPDGAFTAK